jgi:hypothetical protein
MIVRSSTALRMAPTPADKSLPTATRRSSMSMMWHALSNAGWAEKGTTIFAPLIARPSPAPSHDRP